jgi:hypothetical protein
MRFVQSNRNRAVWTLDCFRGHQKKYSLNAKCWKRRPSRLCCNDVHVIEWGEFNYDRRGKEPAVILILLHTRFKNNSRRCTSRAIVMHDMPGVYKNSPSAETLTPSSYCDRILYFSLPYLALAINPFFSSLAAFAPCVSSPFSA